MSFSVLRRPVAGLTAAVAWAALALQFWLLLETLAAQGQGVNFALWRLLGYFTILTNLAVAVVGTTMTLKPSSPLAGHRVRMATTTAIVIVGIVYSVVLRALWSPTGWQAVADHALHDVTPPLFLIAWLLSERAGLPWRTALWGMVGPLLYCVYALTRGAFDNWYAYPFLNPTTQSPAELAVAICALTLAFLAVALLLVAVDRWLARRSPSLRRTHGRG